MGQPWQSMIGRPRRAQAPSGLIARVLSVAAALAMLAPLAAHAQYVTQRPAPRANVAAAASSAKSMPTTNRHAANEAATLDASRSKAASNAVVHATAATSTASDDSEVVGEEAACQPVREFWVVSARCAPACGDVQGSEGSLNYWRAENGKLRPASLAELVDPARPLPTIFYAHGNGLAADEAIRSGWELYNGLSRCSCASFRVVLWSWPADGGNLNGFKRMRDHEAISDTQGYYMAWVMRHMPTTAPMTTSGHSLGNAAALAALHHLGGGQIGPRHLGLLVPPPGMYHLRGAFIASAVDNDSLLPGEKYDLATEAAERLVIFFNPRDKLLRFWPLVSYERRPAMGRTGLVCESNLGPEGEAKVEQVCATPYVEKQHGRVYYFESPAIDGMLRNVVTSPMAVATDLEPAELVAP